MSGKANTKWEGHSWLQIPFSCRATCFAPKFHSWSFEKLWWQGHWLVKVVLVVHAPEALCGRLCVNCIMITIIISMIRRSNIISSMMNKRTDRIAHWFYHKCTRKKAPPKMTYRLGWIIRPTMTMIFDAEIIFTESYCNANLYSP